MKAYFLAKGFLYHRLADARVRLSDVDRIMIIIKLKEEERDMYLARILFECSTRS